VKISLVIPTNRTSYSAFARILEAASLDSDKFELIVRDNSEDEKKRAFLSLIESPTMRLFNASNRGAFENFLEALRLSTGDFVFLVGDDDWISTRGMEQLYSRALSINGDNTFAMVTGDCLVEASGHTGIVRYEKLDSESPEQRLTGYLTARAPNVLYFSAVRRPLIQRCYSFLESLPYKLSFHDQLVCLIYLVAGRAASVERVVYVYDLGIWDTADGTLAKDRASYRDAGLPIEVDRIHWLICGMEGAILLKSNLMSEFSYDRDRMVDLWFSTYFMRFKHLGRESGYSDTAANTATQKLKDKWLRESRANLNELLFDICDVFEIVDKEGAERYFNFWSSV
jgi:glycosyltransferase involved in cell wall biosynthesis